MGDSDDTFSFREHIPRDRNVYRAIDHFMRRVRTNGRFITEKLVRDLIENGTLTGNRPGKGGWLFVSEYDGVEMKLVCDIGPELEPRIVTGVSDIIDRDEAIDSDRWGKHTVQQVELRSALSSKENKVPKDKMQKIECVRSISVKDHDVISARSWDHVKCLHCGLQTRSKAELAGTPCDT